jgi:ssDNA-binding Zn-finger/Zn-ribbon topoisomerase 1
VVEGRECPKCGSPLIVRQGKYGPFVGCSAYPQCRHIEPLEKPEDTGVACPQCREGTLRKRKSRRGKIFYSCSTYPACDYAVWNEPVAEPCPRCGWPVLTVKTTQRRGAEKACPQKECGYHAPLEGAAEAEGQVTTPAGGVAVAAPAPAQTPKRPGGTRGRAAPAARAPARGRAAGPKAAATAKAPEKKTPAKTAPKPPRTAVKAPRRRPEPS